MLQHMQLHALDKLKPVFIFIFKNGPSPASFSFIFGLFKNKQYNFYNKSMWKNVMLIQAPGFELTTFGTWVSSQNH